MTLIHVMHTSFDVDTKAPRATESHTIELPQKLYIYLRLLLIILHSSTASCLHIKCNGDIKTTFVSWSRHLSYQKIKTVFIAVSAEQAVRTTVVARAGGCVVWSSGWAGLVTSSDQRDISQSEDRTGCPVTNERPGI